MSMNATKSTAATTAITARPNRTTSRREARRASSWRLKKFMRSVLGSKAAKALSTAPAKGATFARAQVNFTCGTARFSGDSISSSCAGVNVNMPATMLFGNISRVLL